MVGGPPALQAALENARIDAFILSPPEAQIATAGGYGAKFIGMSDDFPELRAVPFLVLVTKTPVADPARLTRLLRALAAGAEAAGRKPNDTADAIETKFFPKIPAPIIRDGVAALRDGVAGRGALDPAHVEAMIRFSHESGIAIDRVDVSRLWTSKYIDEALQK
jgi:ABC-type nitrate/sulfonate/bicarbonate transport system substrate-binding protein